MDIVKKIFYFTSFHKIFLLKARQYVRVHFECILVVAGQSGWIEAGKITGVRLRVRAKASV